MKAVRLDAPHKFVPFELEEPARPGPGEVLVRTHSIGVCGTDISGYLGKFPLLTYPRIMGHELGIEVLDVGPQVASVLPGDHCSVEPYMNDPSSFASRRGLGNCCERLQVLGVHVDGGMRERFIVRADKLHTSRVLSFEQLALVETLAIGCHAVNRAAPKLGEHLLIIGTGPIGLATLEFARLAGSQITLMDISADRLAFCRRVYGVENAVKFNGDGIELEELRSITNGELFPIVIDATGNAASMSQAVDYLAQGGTLVYVGITTQELSFPHRAIHVREATIKASRNALPDDFRRIIKLIEQGRIDTKPWITHRTSLGEIVETFDSFTKPETGVIKAMIEV